MFQIAKLWFLAAALALSQTQPMVANDWEAPSEADALAGQELGKILDSAVASGELENLHSVLVMRNHSLVLERYYNGSDEIWGRSLGNVQFTPDTLHDLRSVTKSIVSLLYGIALAEGKVPTLETPVVSLFPSYADLGGDPERRRIKIEHLLTMTMGLAWNENLPYTDPRNSEIAMENAQDRYRFVLSQPIVSEPGTTWTYTGGATAVLGHLISRGVEQSLMDYAREKLFDPLSITGVEWIKSRNGEESAASGLRMTPRDLAKIGRLILNNGRWNDAQVVPADWLAASFTEGISGSRYGYHWPLPRNHKWSKGQIGASGNGGQRLVIFPESSLVVVITAGNYNLIGQSNVPRKILREFVLPALAN